MERIWKCFNFFEEAVMVLGGLIMVVFNFLNVVCRYLLPQTPFSYTEELVVIVFVWVSMFGISYGYRKGSHTVLTILSDTMHGSLKVLVVVISTLASALLMYLLAKTGYKMVLNQIKFGQILPGMQIPMYLVGWAVPVGAAVSLVSVLRSGWLEVRALISATTSLNTTKENNA